MQITVHASAKRFANGFVPMVTLRADKGRMIGCKCPEGSYREFRTFTTAELAREEAKAICERMAARYPAALRAA
jgi:hypothetical protein